MRAPLLLVLIASCTPAPPTTPEPPPPTVTVPPDPSPEPTPATEPATEPPDTPTVVAETKLPKTTDPILEDPTLIVNITAQGDFLVDGAALSDAAALQQHAAKVAAADPTTRVIIMADPAVRYARVIDAMDAVRNGGLSHFVFAVQTSPATPPPPPPP